MEAVSQLVMKWVTKLPNPPAPSSPFGGRGPTEADSTPLVPSPTPIIASSSVDIHALLDIKYSLIILENATYLTLSFSYFIFHISYAFFTMLL